MIFPMTIIRQHMEVYSQRSRVFDAITINPVWKKLDFKIRRLLFINIFKNSRIDNNNLRSYAGMKVNIYRADVY